MIDMAELPEYDATNCVRLCDRCELAQGVGAGADAGDRACAACGQHTAPHVYPAYAEIQRLRQAVDEARPYVQACISHPNIGGDDARRWLLQNVETSRKEGGT